MTLTEKELKDFNKQKQKYNPKNLGLNFHATQAAYILYTSGSTGKPKGVTIQHAALLDYTNTFIEYYSISRDDKIIQQSSISFDTMIEELFPCLLTGARALVVKFGGKNISGIMDCIQNKGATILSTTPLVLQEINQEITDVFRLRIIISGGDVLEPGQVSNLLSKEVEIYNTYGPTETTVCATYKRVSAPADFRSIGKVIPNRTIYILDDNQQLAPMLVEGEIYIGGAGLALHYHNQADLTTEKFIRAAFMDEELIYKSGDLGRWLPNGEIAFLGRKDKQIKIRGHRVELGEIEHALQLFEGIQSALVVNYNSGDEKEKIIGFYSSKETVNASVLRKHILERLPAYMLPNELVWVEEWPRTVQGKTNKEALLIYYKSIEHSHIKHDEAETETERMLMTIWYKILSNKKIDIGIYDNYFVIGGDSMSMIKMKQEIDKTFQISTELGNLMHASSLKDVAIYIDSIKWLSKGQEAEFSQGKEVFEI